MLEACGYEILRPVTGDPATDPLLAGIDLLAYNREQALAITVMGGTASSKPIEPAAASALSLAAWTCADTHERLGLPTTEVEPWLVLTGIKASDATRLLAQRLAIRILEIPRPEVTKIGRARTPEDLLRMARIYLGLSGSPPTKAVAGEGGAP